MPERVSLKGVFNPLTTPFDADGRISLADLRKNVARYNGTRLTGYVVTGSTGEAILLSMAETEAVWQMVAETAAPGRLLIAGTAAESTAETIARSRRAAEFGYSVALVRTPHYFRPQITPAALEQYYRRIADASPIPVLIYSIPQFTGITVEPPLASRLADHPNIIGLKDSSGSVQRVAEVVRLVPQRFHVLVGSASILFASVLMGISGGIMALANALPEECVDLYEGTVAGRYEDARLLQEKILPASETLVSRYGVPGMKYALDRLGYYGGPVREPLLPVSEAARREIDDVLVAFRGVSASPAA